jgi:hypothetical protein
MPRLHLTPLSIAFIVLLFVALSCCASVASASSESPTAGATVTIEDFSDIVT